MRKFGTSSQEIKEPVEREKNQIARARLDALPVGGSTPPTSAMIEAGQKAVNLSTEPGTYEFLSHDEIVAIWQAMCDAESEEWENIKQIALENMFKD